MSDEKRLGRPPRHKAITEAPGAKDQAPRDDEADDEDQDVFSRYRDDINKYGWEEVFLGL